MERNGLILVKVASYRDSELPLTIASCIQAARNPENLRFAIVNQTCEQTKSQLSIFKEDPRFSILEFPWQVSKGLGWARHLCDRMWSDEQFSLQIDSHMRFGRDWDYSLKEQWEALNDPKGIISCYPSAYEYTTTGTEYYKEILPHKIVTDGATASGIPLLRGGAAVAPLSRTLFVAGGFQFGPGEISRKVPQLSEIFVGDETAHSIRLFTHGYNVYAPSRMSIYHLYVRHEKITEVQYWHKNCLESGNPELRKRYNSVASATHELMDRILFGDATEFLGTERSREQFYDFAESQFTENRTIRTKEAATSSARLL